MRDHGDPQKDGTSRHTKLASRRSKGSQRNDSQKKVARRSLSSELSSSEDASKELTGISLLSEPLDANPHGEVTEITVDSADILLESSRSNNSKITSLGVDELGNLLITARKQVLESLDANGQSMKLLDALMKSNIDKFSHMSEGKARFDGLISHKICLPFLCIIFGILLAIVFSSGLEGSQGGLLPT